MAQVKSRIKKGDNVKVIAGKHKGSEGEVIAVFRDTSRVLVKNVNVIKKSQRPTQDNPHRVIALYRLDGKYTAQALAQNGGAY